MLALSIVPGVPDSALLLEVAEPRRDESRVLARTLAIGVCGTDREILAGAYGVTPPGHERLIIGHESLAEVVDAPAESGLRAGELIVGIVRRPDPVPCEACRVGEWDMCRNGLYTEHGIKELDGFCVERFTIEADACIALHASLRETGVLLEPASVVAKAWDHIERIGARTHSWRPRTALVTGAGPIGLLAALFATQRDLDVHVYDRETSGAKPRLVRQLGAHYHSASLEAACALDADVIVECTSAAPVIAAVVRRNGAAAIVCLAGLSSGAHRVSVDLTAVNRSMVLQNDVVFGSVNANKRHYLMAAKALAHADQSWLRSLITRRVPLAEWTRALVREPDDIKVVIDVAS